MKDIVYHWIYCSLRIRSCQYSTDIMKKDGTPKKAHTTDISQQKMDPQVIKESQDHYQLDSDLDIDNSLHIKVDPWCTHVNCQADTSQVDRMQFTSPPWPNLSAQLISVVPHHIIADCKQGTGWNCLAKMGDPTLCKWTDYLLQISSHPYPSTLDCQFNVNIAPSFDLGH